VRFFFEATWRVGIKPKHRKPPIIRDANVASASSTTVFYQPIAQRELICPAEALFHV
jgi:hypothetical protein